jgi:nitroreductase
VEITDELVDDLATHAQLAPSCFNNQPTRFVFVYSSEMLPKLKEALNRGNSWATAASLIIAVLSKEDMDCDVKGRLYYLFDSGQATAFLQLRATELGFVAHPIAGYDEVKVKEILGIPEDMTVITLVIVGKKSDDISPLLSEKQAESEQKRPERIPLSKFVYRNQYTAD